MTFALVAVNHTTLGGIYYCANFTTSGAQPTWTRLTTTGLPSLQPWGFRVDYGNPLDNHYLAFGNYQNTTSIYARTGGNWSLIMDLTIASTVVGTTIETLSSLWTDPTTPGSVFTIAENDIGIFGNNNYVLKSLDNGATWAVMGVPFGSGTNPGVWLNVIGNYAWFSTGRAVGAACFVVGSLDGGATWGSLNLGGFANAILTIDNKDPSYCYSYMPTSGTRVHRITAPNTISNLGPYAVGAFDQPDKLFTDPNNDGYAVKFTGGDMVYTVDRFVNFTNVDADFLVDMKCITSFWNQTTDDLVCCAEANSSIYHLSSKTDTTGVNRSGANDGVAPYTDSIPNVGAPTEYSIWAGSQPADVGVYVYSVEEGDITNIPDADNLGLPLFGDRSSWRDFDADDDGNGTPLADYHAQDIQEDTPQRHNPWPASSGQAPVSDGTKWVPTDIITQAEFDYSFYVVSPHCPVTLDVDAETILDLQGGCVPPQEIGLDVQQPTHVFIGPSFMPPDEPTFRPMYIEELANVITTAPVLDGEVLTFDGGTGQWINDEPARHNRIVTTLTAGTYTLDSTYDVVVLDATAGDITINLPGTAANDGLEYAFKRIDATANIVSIMPADTTLLDSDGEILTDSDVETLTDSDGGAGDTIDGETVQYMDSQYLAIQIVADADGSSWWII